MALIYHLTTVGLWEKALDSGFYHAPSLDSEGFIHCSTREQLLRSATLHFREEEELIVLAIVDRRVREHLRWEPSRNGELFPHIYHKLPLDAVETTYMLSRNQQGEWEFIN